MKVLIVEDEMLIAMHLRVLVLDFGHAVCAIGGSALEAIALAVTHSPDLVLMDIRLAGGSSGIEAARELHSTYGLRCIFLSANLDGQMREAALSCDPLDLLGKPILPTQLQKALERAEATLGLA